jgi:hypothetical protein
MKLMNSQTGTTRSTRSFHRHRPSAPFPRSLNRSAWFGWALVCAWCSCVAINAAETKPSTTNQPPAKPAPAKSVFVDDLQGKDPFFPNSTRRIAKKPGPVQVNRVVGPKDVRLSGIVGNDDRRVALINNQALEAGEQRTLRSPISRQQFLLRCVEIRETSVVVTIGDGTERFEIQLAEFGLPVTSEPR